jgi:hypothetical protein
MINTNKNVLFKEGKKTNRGRRERKDQKKKKKRKTEMLGLGNRVIVGKWAG